MARRVNHISRMACVGSLALLLAGCSITPSEVAHDISKAGTRTEFIFDIGLGQTYIFFEERFVINLAVPADKSNMAWWNNCYEHRDDRHPCNLPGRYRVKLFDTASDKQVLDVSVSPDLTSPNFSSTYSGEKGGLIVAVLADCVLKAGRYRISVENLEEVSDIKNTAGEILIYKIGG